MIKDMQLDQVHTMRTYSADRDQMILRDWLALDRTIMANERTFLAWVRTGLSIFLAGVTMIKFVNDVLFDVIGIVFIIGGLSALITGSVRYAKLSRKCSRLYH